MIAAGVMKACRSTTNPYMVALLVGRKYQRINYFIRNPNYIPYELRKAMDCGEQVAGIFEFVETDQFASYRMDEEVEIKVS